MMIFPDESPYAIISLSSLVIFLIILFNCAKRGKENGENENPDNQNWKDEYTLLCFPCLRKKPVFQDIQDIETNQLEVNDQYEYIVEKYAIRKVPFVMANTTEEMEKIRNQMETGDGGQEGYYQPQHVYSVHGSHPGTPRGQAGCDRETAKDILDNGPVQTPSTSDKLNYVAIPSKVSAHHRDIMMTKREITNQYLNNFSSVFVDNLKDPVPKDPEQFPSLGKPFTSAIKHIPLEDMLSISSRNIPRVTKSSRLVYNVETVKDEERPSTSGAVSKTVFLVHPKEKEERVVEGISTPFKTILYSHPSGTDDDVSVSVSQKPFNLMSFTHKQEINKPKMITYEDIQSLDVGYDFPNSERHGVKPKMVRIRGNYESERSSKPPSITSTDTSRPPDFKPPPKRYYTDVSPEFKRKYPRHSYAYNETSFLFPPKSPRVSANNSPRDEKPTEEVVPFKISPKDKPEVKDPGTSWAPGSGHRPQSRTSSRHSSEPKPEDSPTVKDEATQSVAVSRSQSFDNVRHDKNTEIASVAARGMHKRTTSNEEFETDTTGSLYSRESKTSSLVTTPRSSEPQIDKKQTLRWKIIIKHHKDGEAEK